MKKKLLTIGYCFTMLSSLPLQSVSLVYNLRIAQTTRRQAQQQAAQPSQRHSIFSATLVDQFYKLHDDTRQNVTGGIGTYNYATKDYYFRVIGAAGHVKSKRFDELVDREVTFARTQTDDILFSGGYNYRISDRATVTFSGLLGLPTHKDRGLEGIQMGTGHVGLGGQFDGAFAYAAHDTTVHSIMTAARLVHFFPRKAGLAVNEQPLSFDVELGNIGDLLIAHYSRWGRHAFEIGYNPGFAFGAKINPPIPELSSSGVLVRSSFYAAYLYGFLIKDMLSAINFGLSYSFDHNSRPLARKYIVSLWVTWGINF
jgi:hypothetical protein